ncbi:MAG: trypsin-like peptidase domain-containing protein [Planctomycetota bacterium]|jgi:serine protease Do|nr:trypsin-like peptidase domain-containing protein [Planctomycetota bacterium]
MTITLKDLFVVAALSGVATLFVARPALSGPEDNDVNLLELSDDIANLAEKVSKGTVFLTVRRNDGRSTGYGRGTGFVVDAVKGIVVTNAHVVENAQTATVQFADGREVSASLLGVDEKTDLAVMSIPAGSARYQLEWGDSDVLRPGNLVMAVGSPLGLEGTTSLGVVSALGRSLGLVEDSYEDFIQFDAFIDQGSSGGPLVNMEGQVIGINTAIGGGSSRSEPMWRGIGYAIPTAIAKRYVDDLTKLGEVRRGWIGISAKEIDAQRADLLGLDHVYGVTVVDVVKGGPAEKAGIKINDVIVEIEGLKITSPKQVKARIAALAPGYKAKVKLLSNRAFRTIRVELGEREETNN